MFYLDVSVLHWLLFHSVLEMSLPDVEMPILKITVLLLYTGFELFASSLEASCIRADYWHFEVKIKSGSQSLL